MLSVFYAVIPDRKPGKTGNAIRNGEIASSINQKVKKQKYFVWELLLIALSKLGFNPDEINFFKSPSGKWLANGVEFSLSHCQNLIAVAVSDSFVGVDLEMIKPIDEKIAVKILNDTEFAKFNALSPSEKLEYLILKWTEKESIFKSLNEGVCRYKELSNLDKPTTSKKIKVDDCDYFLTVCHSENCTPSFTFVTL